MHFSNNRAIIITFNDKDLKIAVQARHIRDTSTREIREELKIYRSEK